MPRSQPESKWVYLKDKLVVGKQFLLETNKECESLRRFIRNHTDDLTGTSFKEAKFKYILTVVKRKP